MTTLFAGRGIHTGVLCRIRVDQTRDGPIVFDTGNGPIAAEPATIRNKGLSTSLQTRDSSVQTVEHLAAALWATGGGARVTIDGPEIPIMDGSAGPFYRHLTPMGPPLHRRLRYRDMGTSLFHGPSSARICPPTGDTPVYQVQLDYPTALTGPPVVRFRPFRSPFSEVADARTFALERDLDTIRRMGRGKGGSLSNTLIIGNGGAVNPGGMRYCDEPARHKLLDLLGDLALLGGLPYGDLWITHPGHAINHRLVHVLNARLLPPEKTG